MRQTALFNMYDEMELKEKFAAMLQQESTNYHCRDYLRDPPPVVSRDSMTISSSLSSTSSSQSSVNEIWREKICEWSYQVVDHYDFNREVVSISLSYLDRFLSSRQVNKKIFQLAAMTTLYLAIKVHEPGKLRMSSLIELSRGYFRVEHVSAMEEEILSALSYFVHPPTPLTQVRHLLMLFPPSENTTVARHDLSELSRFLTELSVCDYFFVNHKFSSIAMAAILTAIEEVPDHRLLIPHKQWFFQNIREIAKIDPASAEIKECCLRIRNNYYELGRFQHHSEDETMGEQIVTERIESTSPVNVNDDINYWNQPQSDCFNIALMDT